MSTPYYNKEDPMDNKKGDDAEIYVTDAVPTQDEGPPVAAGHARFYCSSCHTVRCWIEDGVGIDRVACRYRISVVVYGCTFQLTFVLCSF
jgi:hypothetical protein